MKTSYLLMRAVRGPIVLIVLGALFAFDHADMLGFERTWPILIIVLGVFKLIERLLAPPAPQFGAGPYQAPPTQGGWQ